MRESNTFHRTQNDKILAFVIGLWWLSCDLSAHSSHISTPTFGHSKALLLFALIHFELRKAARLDQIRDHNQIRKLSTSRGIFSSSSFSRITSQRALGMQNYAKLISFDKFKFSLSQLLSTFAGAHFNYRLRVQSCTRKQVLISRKSR